MADKLVWLTYGATGETLADVPLARWHAFPDDAAAQEATLHAGYAFAVIADAQGGKARLTWTEVNGWQGVQSDAKANTSTVHPAQESITDTVGWNKRAINAVADDDTAVSG